MHVSDDGALLHDDTPQTDVNTITLTPTQDPSQSVDISQNDLYKGIEIPCPVDVPGLPLPQDMADLINDTWGKPYLHKQLLPIYSKYPTPANIS